MTALLLSNRYNVLLFEKEKTLGRKFLVAGKGGFNLTNNANQSELIEAYHPVGFLDRALDEFTANNLRELLLGLGIETYVGSSNRVFPVRGIKPAEVLKVMIDAIYAKGVTVFERYQLLTINERELVFRNSEEEEKKIAFDFCVLALGGASWSKTGSDGLWSGMLKKNGVEVLPFQASNCGVNIDWPASFLMHHEGKPLKNIEISIGGEVRKGEALITQYGLEGNVIYPLINKIRTLLNKGAIPTLFIDLKPNNTEEELLEKVKYSKPNNYAKKLKLGVLEKSLLKHFTTKESYLNYKSFVKAVKSLPISISSLRPIEESISTVGGVTLESLNPNFSLKVNPAIYSIGEMVDWDAPTGGFLLQGCFSMANAVAIDLNNQLD